MLKKLLGLLSDAAVYGLTSVVSQIISFLLLPLYTTHLGPEDYGVVAMLTIITVVYQPIANLGISNAIFRRFNVSKDEGERRRVAGTGLLSVLGSSGVLLLLSVVLARPLTGALIGDPERAHLVLLTLLTGFVSSVSAMPQAILRSERRVRTTGMLNVFQVTSTILVTIVLVVVVRVGVLGVVLGSLTGEAVLAIGALIATRRSVRLELDREALRAMLSYGLPLVPHQLQAVGLSYLSQYLLKEKVGLEDAGLFNMAQKFALPVQVVVGAIQRAWGPYKFHIHATDREPAVFFRTALTYYVGGTAYLWMGVSVWGPEVLRFMMNERFYGAAPLIPAAATIPLMFGIRCMVATGRELTDKTGPMPLVTFAGLITVAASSLLLIPALGAMGAALSTTLGWVIMALGDYWLAQRVFRVDHQWGIVFGQLGLATAIVVGAQVAASHASTAARLVFALVASLVFPVLAALLLARSPEDRDRMRTAWDRVRTRLGGLGARAS